MSQTSYTLLAGGSSSDAVHHHHSHHHSSDGGGGGDAAAADSHPLHPDGGNASEVNPKLRESQVRLLEGSEEEPKSPHRSASAHRRRNRSSALSRRGGNAEDLVASLHEGNHIELQIETMSPATGRFMFIFWYSLLALAIIIQSIPSLQWEATNICLSADSVPLTSINTWMSNCARQVTYEENISSAISPQGWTLVNRSDVIWTGYITSDPLARFPHVVFSMRNPNITISATYRVSFALAITNASLSQAQRRRLLFDAEITCEEGIGRCDTAVLSVDTTGRTNATLVTLVVADMDPLIASQIVNGSAVGNVYQKEAYTIASICVRYILMFFSLLHLARFLYHKKFTNSLYEQTWISFLHAGLFCFLDPLFAVGIYVTPMPNVLAFLEFRVPTYFMALLVAFMFSLITSSMSWTSTTSIYDPPWWTKVASLLFLLTIFVLDIVDASTNDYQWSTEHCPNFSCNTLGYVLYSVLLSGVLGCTVWLYWLRDNLGKKPYLESRPQQLAVRVFIFMFTATVAYFIIQSLTIVFGYRDISGIVTFQALIQIPPILVSVFFVNIMTFVYTTTARTEKVPIRPSDARWKSVAWPESWYQWLIRHGGSMYIFYSEEEERAFNAIQKAFEERRARAQLAKEAIYANFDYQEDVNDGSEAKAQDTPNKRPIRQQGSTTLVDQHGEGNNDAENRRKLEEAEAEGSHSEEGSEEGSDDEEDDGPSYPSLPRARSSNQIFDAVSNVTRSVSRLVTTAENTLVDRTATFLEAVEDRFVRTFQTNTSRKPFFNLETAIDCLNLSWEAYGVVNSEGDDMITTGVNVRIPEVVSHLSALPFALFGGGASSSSLDDEDAQHQQHSTIGSGNSDEERRRRGATQPSHELTPLPTNKRNNNNNNSFTNSPTASNPEYGSTTLPQATSPTSADPNASPPIDVEKYGYVRIGVFEANAVQVVLSKMDLTAKRHDGKEPRIVVAFRGTNSLKNAKQDLSIRRRAWDEVDHGFWESASRNRASVHEGFLGIWEALRDFVVTSVRDELALDPGVTHRVVCTGHSMGGAVAVLAAFVVHKLLVEISYPCVNPIVYTYGQPRVGNKTFQKIFNRAVPHAFRIVNESDVVSFVTMFGGCHVGMEVDIDRNGNYICEPMFMERTLRPTKGKGSAIANHMLTAYGDSLNSIANKVNVGESRALIAYVPLEERRQSIRRYTTAPSPRAGGGNGSMSSSRSQTPTNSFAMESASSPQSQLKQEMSFASTSAPPLL